MTESGRTPVRPPPPSAGSIRDGTVYVRTADGERSVGQVPDVPAEEALAFFTRRYEALELEVSLLQTRITSGALSPDDALASVRTVRTAVVEAPTPSVTWTAWCAGWTALLPVIADAAGGPPGRAGPAATRRPGPPRNSSCAEAERLAAGNDWRGGVNRFRALLDQWKALPRLDRATDDELWHRFSSARTAYTRRRKAQFARAERGPRGGPGDQGDSWSPRPRRWRPRPTGARPPGAYRDLMTRWKAAGPAPRGVDEALWKRFRGAQDTFFAAKQAALQPAGQRVPGQRRGQGGAAGRGGGVAAGPRPRRGPRGVPGHPEPLGGDRQGAARRHPAARQPAARGGDRDRRGRGASAGGGPTRRPGPGPRTPRPSSRPRSSPWRSGPPRPRPAATTAPPGRPPSRRPPTGSG